MHSDTLKQKIMIIKELYEIYKAHPVITTDSRDCPEGSIFVALKGEKFNGNQYAVQALEKGCAYAIVDEEIDAKQWTGRIIRVDDALQTFKDIAREHRRQFNIPVIGVTGTNGKTTTKELIAAVLSEKYNVHYTRGNFNNDVGVPKTLLQLNEKHEIAVIEMGASHPGDIKTLVETVEPTCGIITNVGHAHLQGFGSFDGVKRTKGELYDYLIDNGQLRIDNGELTMDDSAEPLPIFINADNADLMAMAAERHAKRLIKYGTIHTPQPSTLNSQPSTHTDQRSTLNPQPSTFPPQHQTTEGRVIDCSPFLHFSWHSNGGAEHEVMTHLIGAYNIDNMLAAATIGLHFGVSEDQVCHALANYTPTNNRSQLTVTQHNHLIVDAYNANPTSMKAAIDNLAAMDVPQKMAILGDMRELGEVSAEEHQRIVDLLQAKGITDVWLVGDEFCGTRCPYRKFRSVEEVASAIAENQPQGKYILIKGSNGIRLYTLPEVL